MSAPRLVPWTVWSAAEERRWLRQARARRKLPDYARPEGDEAPPVCAEPGCQVAVTKRQSRCALHRQQRATQKHRERARRQEERRRRAVP